MDDDTTARARELAAYWHGGQGSALYALASTGSTTDTTRLRLEIDQAERETDAVADESGSVESARSELAELRQWVNQLDG